jgi:hypothetical protein
MISNRVILGLLVVAGVFACSGATCVQDITTEPREAKLQTFKSAEALQAYLADQVIAERNGSNDRIPFLFDVLPMPVAAPPSEADADAVGATDEAGADSGAESDPFSTTNVQEPGVDESDVVKNDGTYLYLVKNDELRIVQASPVGSLAQVGRLALPASVDSLYLKDDTVVALSRAWPDWGWDGPIIETGGTGTATAPEAQSADVSTAQAVSSEPVLTFDGGQTTVTLIDVSDRANPTVIETLTFDGGLASSRLIDNHLHLILTMLPVIPYEVTPEEIRAIPLEDWIPDYAAANGDGSSFVGDMATWDAFYYPANADGYGMTFVVTVDIDDPSAMFESKAISADAGTIYASTSALYVTDTDYDYSGSWRTDTVIHKFALSDDGADYVASGLIPGRLLNQYSLGEHEGYLRAATTVSSFSDFQSTSANAIYVLGEGETAGELATVGKIENIAPGEDIKSARFIGDRGFLVTFKKIDPLFTCDLSDPTDPQLAGTLKVPGYSEYIHLMDENHLLTIGRDADDMGDFAWFQGVQLSIFDVTDFANPTLLHKELIGTRGTSSEAETDPKAFNYFTPLDALAIPIDLYEGDTSGPEYGEHTFTGLYVYGVTTADGFSLLGRIATQDVVDPSPYVWWPYDRYTRGVFIGDTVYAVTDSVVRAGPVDNPASLTGDLTLPE